MCGITGSVHSPGDGPDPQAALAAVRHRGPDGSGFLTLDLGERSVFFGHTRLAIQDLSEAGAQPMHSADQRWLISFNGEIYNHLQLRTELGGSWRGLSDTETLVEALSRWGVDRTVQRLNGIFAFAALDRQERKLYVVRDPFGVKPVYYAQVGQRFGFSSEIRGLSAVLGHQFGVDSQSLGTYLSLRFVPSPYTLLEGVMRLPPGHLLCRSIGTGEQTLRCYAQPGRERFQGTLADATQALHDGVALAVKRQLLSDVPVGVLLSGGIDSALIAGMAADAGVKTPCFTVGYQGQSTACEIDDAAQTAQVLGLAHHLIRVDHEDLWNILESAVGSTEEPLVTPSALPMWYLCQRARQDVTVVLTGQGSDELLGGYRRYRSELVRDMPFYKSGLALLRPLLEKLPRVSDAVLRSARSASIEDMAHRFESAYSVFPADARQRLSGRDEAPRAIEAIRKWLAWTADGRALTNAEEMMAIDTRLGLADDLLLYGDKISMAHGLEARVPLLDTELVRLVESMPASYKLGMYSNKIVLKRMARRYLPASIVGRPKKGFLVPVGEMLRSTWKDRCHAVLFEGSALEDLGLASTQARLLWDQHQRGFRDHTRELFALLGLLVWKRGMGVS